MLIVLVAGTLIGAVLSLRLNVLVLVPATCASLIIVAVGEAARGDTFWYIAGTMVLVATALQLGYLGSSAFLAVAGSRRASNPSREEISARMSRPI